MKLKKFISAALALAMSLSLSVPAFAADDEHRTEVTYSGTGEEAYFLTVPASLKPGADGTVTLRGTWASNRTFSVSADKTVTMNGSLGGSKTLDITFDGITLAGSNEVEVKDEKSVAVADMTALFGEWTGTFYYNVSGTGGSESANPGGEDSDKDNTQTVTDWSSKVKLRNITSEEYNLLCDATNEDNGLMHWSNMYSITDTIYNENASLRVVRGCDSARVFYYYSVSGYGYLGYGGFRPAFKALAPDTDCADLSVGDVVVMGTLYVGGEALKVPTNPRNSGDVTAYDKDYSGIVSQITLGETLEDTAYQVKAVYVGDGLFVCDRVMLNYISWNQINAALS